MAMLETVDDLFEVSDAEMLDVLLRQSYIDVTIRDNDGRTLLLKSLNLYRSDSFIMRLLEANCDPNISDKYKETPLYAAVTRPTIIIAHELIKRGADVNVMTKLCCSSLHQAVDYNNFEAVCLLLYYGADANVLSKNNTTPLMNALAYGDVSASEVLINYYDNDECLNNVPQGCTALYFAIKRGSPLAVRLVEMGADVNYVTPHGENLLVFSLFYSNATLFKLIWVRFDHEIFLNTKRPFLLSYIKNCCFPVDDWVDSLHLILNSCVAFELVQDYNSFIKNERKDEFGGFFHELLKSFHRKSVELSDRLSIIYVVLNLTAEVNICDITTAYELYGFNDELEIFIYFINYDNIANEYHECKFVLIPFILALEDNFACKTPNIVCQLHSYISTCIRSQADSENNWLGFFTRSCYIHLLQHFPAWWIMQQSEISEKLLLIPEFPSLLELSRNQARKFIRSAYKITRPYQFHDVVKSLNLPQCIKDVIRFKAPVYK